MNLPLNSTYFPRLRFVVICLNLLLSIGFQSFASESFDDLLKLKVLNPTFREKKRFNVQVVGLLPDQYAYVVSDGFTNVRLQYPKANLGDYSVGDQLEIVGKVQKSPSLLTIHPSKIKRIGKSELNLAPSQRFDNFDSRRVLRSLQLQRIEVRGTVISAYEIDNGCYNLEVQGSRGSRILIKGYDIGNKEVFEHIGCVAKIRGFLWFPFTNEIYKTSLDVPLLYFHGHENIELYAKEANNPVRIEGEIVEVLGNKTYRIKSPDKDRLVEVRILPGSGWLKKGKYIEGWVRSRHSPNKLNKAFNVSACRIIPHPDYTSEPEVVSFEEGNEQQHLQIVELFAYVKGDPENDIRNRKLLVESESLGSPITVELPKGQSLIEKQLIKAERVKVTGYLKIEPKELRIAPQHYHQIEVLGTIPWTQTSSFRWSILGVFSGLLLSLGLVTYLKLAVNRGTRELDKSLGLLNATYDAVQEGICVIDGEGEICKTNPRFWAILGLDESAFNAAGLSLANEIPKCFEEPEEFMGLWQRLNEDSGIHEAGNLRLASEADGELQFYSVPISTQNSRQIGRIWVFRDITEQRRLEASLYQAQKMEAVGQLAGGVAHDFNNLLTGIIGNLDLAQLDPDLSIGELRAPLSAVDQAAKRAAELVSNLLGFSRQDQLKSKPGCANEVVRELVDLVKPTLDPKIDLEVELEDDLQFSVFDSTKLQQVVLNMVVNSRDVLEGKEGSIIISTKSLEAENPETGVCGQYVRISVNDNGAGMPEDVRDRVFEPFFTTKEQGKGTGLGLATSYGIIKQSAGWITCDSKLGEGTEFNIYLPQADCSIAIDESLPGSKIDLPVRLNCIDREMVEVLCVDDEMVVRRVAEGLLSRLGFRICSAENGLEAMQLLDQREAGGKCLPDIIISDLTMPVMDGKELFKAVRNKYPDIPFVVCSGYLVDLDDFSEGVSDEVDSFIQKPYDSKKFVECIEGLIEETALVS